MVLFATVNHGFVCNLENHGFVCNLENHGFVCRYDLAEHALAEKTSFREKKQDVFDEICELHNSVNSNPPLWLPLQLKAAGIAPKPTLPSIHNTQLKTTGTMHTPNQLHNSVNSCPPLWLPTQLKVASIGLMHTGRNARGEAN